MGFTVLNLTRQHCLDNIQNYLAVMQSTNTSLRTTGKSLLIKDTELGHGHGNLIIHAVKLLGCSLIIWSTVQKLAEAGRHFQHAAFMLSRVKGFNSTATISRMGYSMLQNSSMLV